jgi:radical SAM superfamily enzyme YgiQ (UPF0313 family)
MKPKTAFIMCPCWDVRSPPLNIAYLVGMLRGNGYPAKGFDFNIDAYHKIDKDYWVTHNTFYWEDEISFQTNLFPLLKDLLDSQLDKVMTEYKPDIVGFTCYTQNQHCVDHLVNKIRRDYPDIKILIGGPHSTNLLDLKVYENRADCVVSGEAEIILLDLIKQYEKTGSFKEKVVRAPGNTNLDEIPYPDFTDFDFNDYTEPEQMKIQTSRGCIAKCAFCDEHIYWKKYRFRKAENVVDEIKQIFKDGKWGRLHLVDSLTNGSINEVIKIADLIIENGIDISWSGYARVNKDMDLEYFRKIRQSGCAYYSYGVESGSQKVLDAMNKRFKVEDAEMNFKHATQVGVHNDICIIAGFPTETPVNFMETLLFLFRNKDNLNNVNPGLTCWVAPHTILDLQKERFGIEEYNIFSFWTSYGYNNTLLHRVIRLKLLTIWLKIIGITNSGCYTEDEYTIKSNGFIDGKPQVVADSYETKSTVDEFEKTVRNEYLAFFVALHKIYGSCTFKLSFDQKKTIEKYGDRLGLPYDVDLKFEVTSQGNYRYTINHKLYSEEASFSEIIKKEGVLKGDKYE